MEAIEALMSDILSKSTSNMALWDPKHILVILPVREYIVKINISTEESLPVE